MNYRDVVNNIISDAKLLTKMTARQSSIFRRKIYSRIHDATETEEVHKQIPYPNKKRKIIDKDNNIGSLLIMYKGLMERYNAFTNKSKVLLKKNYELEKALYDANNSLYYKIIEKICYQLMLISVIVMFIRMDVQTFISYKCIYEKYRKLFIEFIVLFFVYLLETYLLPLFNLLVQGYVFLHENYLSPLVNYLLDWFINVFGA